MKPSEVTKHPRMFGYIRVSSADQNEARQRDALRQVGIPDSGIFTDRKSGKDFERPSYQRLLKKLRQGDVLYVLSIDRLGRNYRELPEQWRFITRELGVDICVLDMPLLDTRRGKDLIGTFISDLVLQVLSFVAQSERESIRQRQAQGIAAALARGVHLGRPPRKLPPLFPEIAKKYLSGNITLIEASRQCGMPPSTFRSYALKIA